MTWFSPTIFIAFLTIYSTNATLVVRQSNKDLSIPLNIDIPEEEISFCVSLRFQDTIAKAQLGQWENDLLIWFRFQDSYGWINFDEVLYIFLLPENHGVQPLTWFQLCFSSNDTNYHIFSQGKVW